MRRWKRTLLTLVLCSIAIACSDDDDEGSANGGEDPPPMIPCDGGLLDPATDLCWEDPPPAEPEWTWSTTRCADLGEGWRIPQIQELVTLIRGCGSADCAVSNPDCDFGDCDLDATCDQCAEHAGPSSAGCYWDPALHGKCGDAGYRASSGSWAVRFSTARIYTAAPDTGYFHFRCVRDGP